jgi:hypothetical protein
VDAPHADPALDGTCTPSAAVLVCVSGVCDLDDDECGYANGDGSCDSMSAGVVCRSQACSVNGACEPAGGCNVDGDCPGATPECDPTAQVCVAASGGGTGAGSTVTVTATGPTSVELTWTPTTDPDGATTYDIYENGTLVATTSGSTLGTALYALHEPRSRRSARRNPSWPAWTFDQLGAGCSCGGSGGGTVMWPISTASSAAGIRARVAAQYLGASSR